MDYFEYMKEKKNRKRRKVLQEMLLNSGMGSDFDLDQFSVVKHYRAIRSKADGRTMGIIEDDLIILQNDRVVVRADCNGNIAPSILEEGTGTITRFRINGTVRYGVQMDNGEFGYITSDKIAKKL